MNYWRIFCKERDWPGLWRRWLEEECVTLGWPPGPKYEFEGARPSNSRWSAVRKHLRAMEPGDQIVVHLAGNRVGRTGEVIRKRVADEEWAPLVPRSQVHPKGEQGRRIFVRWHSELGPPIPWWVSQLPDGSGFPKGAIRCAVSRLDAEEFKAIQSQAAKSSNFVSAHAWSPKGTLDQFLGATPSLLGEGLQRWPSRKVEARVFPERSRANLLLMERNGSPVVVEWLERTPVVEDLRRLRRSMEFAQKETSIKPRAILVFDRIATLDLLTQRELEKGPPVELVTCSISVELRPLECPTAFPEQAAAVGGAS